MATDPNTMQRTHEMAAIRPANQSVGLRVKCSKQRSRVYTAHPDPQLPIQVSLAAYE
jgi:hypothetical protein